MKQDIGRYFHDDQNNQYKRRQMECRRHPSTQNDGQMHNDHTFVGLEKKAVERHPLVFLVLDKMHEHRNAMTEEQRQAWAAHYDPIRAAFRERPPTGQALLEWKYQRYIKDYLGCVMAVDEGVGRLLDYLDLHGMADNTLLIYTSDQGFFLGEHGWFDKRFMYEEALRVPLLIRYPRAIPGGTTTDAMVLNLDFAPTFLDYAGLEIPGDMQGRSFRSIAGGRIPSDWRSSMYYHYYEYPHGWHNVQRHYGIRTDRYKLIHFYYDMDAWELYDLEKDPYELNNVYDDAAYSRTVKGLKLELARLQQAYGDTEAVALRGM